MSYYRVIFILLVSGPASAGWLFLLVLGILSRQDKIEEAFPECRRILLWAKAPLLCAPAFLFVRWLFAEGSTEQIIEEVMALILIDIVIILAFLFVRFILAIVYAKITTQQKSVCSMAGSVAVSALCSILISGILMAFLRQLTQLY